MKPLTESPSEALCRGMLLCWTSCVPRGAHSLDDMCVYCLWGSTEAAVLVTFHPKKVSQVMALTWTSHHSWCP